jgi:hypothetical protein
MADLRRFRRLARPLQYLSHPADRPTGVQGVTTMTFNISNVQQYAVSVFGALLTATLFVSAAVGPVSQFI